MHDLKKHSGESRPGLSLLAQAVVDYKAAAGGIKEGQEQQEWQHQEQSSS
jgi:hypothetical protein